MYTDNELWEIHFTFKTSHICRLNCRKEIDNDYHFYDAKIETERLCRQFNFLKRTKNLNRFQPFLQGTLDFRCTRCNVFVIIDILSVDDVIVSEDFGLQGMKGFADHILTPKILTQVVNEALLPVRQTIIAWLLSWRHYFPFLGKDVALLIAKMIWEMRYDIS